MELIETVSGNRTACLTFDDGPNPVDTPKLLEVLGRHRVPAVFCLVGQQAQRHPGIVAAIVESGHMLGNHSMRHDDLSAWSTKDIEADLVATNAAITSAAPGVDVPYFRAPYGRWGRSPAVADALGMASLGWRFDVVDWEPPGVDVLVARLRERMAPGAIVLLHDGGGDRSQTVEAVDRIVPELLREGWTFVLPDPAPRRSGRDVHAGSAGERDVQR